MGRVLNAIRMMKVQFALHFLMHVACEHGYDPWWRILVLMSTKGEHHAAPIG